MRISLFFVIFFIGSSLFFMIELYNTKNIPFLDNTIEGVTKVLGIESELVMKKIEEKEKYFKAEKVKKKITLIVKDTSEDILSIKKELITEEFKNIINTKVEIGISDLDTASSLTSEINSETNDLFGSLVSNRSDMDKEKIEADLEKKFFTAFVHNTKPIINDGHITLRLAEAIDIKGQKYNKGFVFEVNTIIFDQKYLLYADLFGVKIKNYHEDFEGEKIMKKHLDKKNNVILTEGQLITMGYN